MNVIQAMGIGLVLVGGFVLWWGMRGYSAQDRRKAQVGTWIRTAAHVEDANIAEREARSAEGYEDTVWVPRLSYTYQVDGRTYRGQRIALGIAEPFATPKDAHAWLLAHAPGSGIDVWYDPADPAESSPKLDLPGRYQAVVSIALGAALILLGLYMLARS